jgi:hypothetical protein
MVADRVISSTYLEGEAWSRREKAPEEWFVGESYVHGIMDGEIMMKLSEKDYPIVEFALV